MNKKIETPLIIAELSSQFLGDMGLLKTLALQAKTAGADAVKVQVRNKLKPHAWIDKSSLRNIKNYCDTIGIELFASVFDLEGLADCLSMGMSKIKIASRTLLEKELVEKAIDRDCWVYISNGFNSDMFPYKADNVQYFYCIAEYPATLDKVKMPNFRVHKYYVGYSDHTYGLTACKNAIVRGAKLIEKHFTLSPNLQFEHEKAHAGGMTMEDLIELKRFSCENALIELED